MVQENLTILLKVFLLHKWRELYIQPSFDDERRFAKIIAGWVKRVGMPSKSFSICKIPDSQGQVLHFL